MLPQKYVHFTCLAAPKQYLLYNFVFLNSNHVVLGNGHAITSCFRVIFSIIFMYFYFFNQIVHACVSF